MTGSAETQGEVADSIHGDAAEPIVHVGIDHRGLLVNERRRRITDLVPANACERYGLNRVVDDQRLVITEVAVGYPEHHPVAQSIHFFPRVRLRNTRQSYIASADLAVLRYGD